MTLDLVLGGEMKEFTCEKCWADAYWRTLCNGKPQAQNYDDLLNERRDDPCTEYERKHGRRVNESRENPTPEEICALLDKPPSKRD